MSDLKRPVVGLSISMPVIATFVVALRFFARTSKKLSLGADDYLALVALLFCYGLSATTLAGVFLGGLGGHLKLGPNFVPVDLKAFTIFSQTQWILQFICIPALGLTKLSVLFFYKRIFAPKPFQTMTWVMAGLVIAWNISFFFANLLDCLPFELNWRQQAGVSGKCIDIIQVFWAVSISNILLDVVAGIVRTVLSAQGVTSQSTDLDYTYSRSPSVYWLIVEANVGVISACLPTVQPLFPALKLDNIMSSMRKTLSWRSKSSTSLHSNDTHPNLVHREKHSDPYNSYTTVESSRGYSPPDHQRGVEVTREIQRTHDMV
ncbi:hypothetical protein JX265_006964 [Neoarthrinium moseri]|uniref:Rhodopsin domain-containing protein n=1 Tax=Neoarthrinium moseri TaxID=1658444 RepID=A0A9Q0ALM4_9PEZI|nr:uncharacterized protein JN550_010190 [Neoarthrinium moseri]KAI1862665.1 hypothetical protein JN550_010190 [Neoarthrinium moseri]KAI1868985.1 hypothetical protein JX265_006964 [Neoarthrinium moseri]